MLKAVIFDLDGVLSDSVGRDIAITVAAYKKFGYSITEFDEQFVIGRHPADRVAFFAKKFDIPDEKQRLIVEVEKRLYRELWDTTSKLLPNVKETLETINKKPRNFTRNLSLERKALPTTFLPMWGSAPQPRKPCKGLVKTLTKNILLVFLLAQVFFL